MNHISSSMIGTLLRANVMVKNLTEPSVRSSGAGGFVETDESSKYIGSLGNAKPSQTSCSSTSTKYHDVGASYDLR